jgi:hypothetical protein
VLTDVETCCASGFEVLTPDPKQRPARARRGPLAFDLLTSVAKEHPPSLTISKENNELTLAPLLFDSAVGAQVRESRRKSKTLELGRG